LPPAANSRLASDSPRLKRPAALADLLEQAAYLCQQSPKAAERFLDAVERSCQTLARTPELGGIYAGQHPRLADVRVWRVNGFDSHLIFYRARESGIEIIRVLHGARDIGPILADE
jgi:toxin ParE1/3/4